MRSAGLSLLGCPWLRHLLAGVPIRSTKHWTAPDREVHQAAPQDVLPFAPIRSRRWRGWPVSQVRRADATARVTFREAVFGQHDLAVWAVLNPRFGDGPVLAVQLVQAAVQLTLHRQVPPAVLRLDAIGPDRAPVSGVAGALQRYLGCRGAARGARP